MSIKTEILTAKVDSQAKAGAEKVSKKAGLKLSEAINLFLKQIKVTKKLPLDIDIPNAKTAKAIRRARTGKSLIKCKNSEDLFNKLGI